MDHYMTVSVRLFAKKKKKKPNVLIFILFFIQKFIFSDLQPQRY